MTTTDLSGATLTLDSAQSVMRIGVKFSSAFSGSLVVDGVSQAIQDYFVDQYYWFDRKVSDSKSVFTVVGTPNISELVAVTSSYDTPLTPMNRDTYLGLSNKFQTGPLSTNYFFEKKVNLSLTLWPVPNNSYDHLTLFIHRQAQDIGSLTNQIEIPQRWLDGIIWLLADRLGYELPNVDPGVAKRVEQKAQIQVFEAELSETDGAPIFLQPNIQAYSR